MPERTTVWRRLAVLLLAGLLITGVAACGDDDDSADDGGDAATTEADDGDDGGGDDGGGDGGGGGSPTEPVIQEFQFQPDPIEVTAGDTVTWTNEDGFAHTVTADDESFDSGNVDGGGTFEHTFDEAGEFTYHCNIHPQMTGTVTVS